MLPRMPSAPQHSTNSVEYSLLPPRSALEARSAPARAGRFAACSTHPYSAPAKRALASDRHPRLGIVHFRGWLIWLVSCYTLRETLPTSMARFQLFRSTNALCGIYFSGY